MITKDNNLRVMEIFFKAPYTPIHIRELARRTKISSAGIIKIVKRLKKEKLLITQKRANLEEIKPDFEGRFLQMKRIYNIFSLSDSGLIDALEDFYEQPTAIVLFGSYAQGMDAEKSDIDIAILSGKNEEIDLEKFEKKLERKINIYLNLNKMTAEFKNSLANGIVLKGYLEIMR